MTDLTTAFSDYRAANPSARIRTAAQDLGASEAQLVATGIDGAAVALAPPAGGWRALLPELEAFGDVMALTRNDACVHERHGVYHTFDVALPHGMALVANEEIDLRLFCARWASAFAVAAGEPGKERRSLQFFDRHGDAVHKVFLTAASDRAAYDAFVDAHRAPTDAAPLTVTPRTAPVTDRPDADIDADAFLAGWTGLQDTHDFFPLLRDHGVGRVQALRLAEGRYTERTEATAVRRAIEAAAADGTPIMVFVGNPGAIQIHTGPVQNLMTREPWFNVLDERFNLHLDETRIAEAYVVVKPTADGDVTAVEAYDAAGNQIVQLFGKRKPGQPELGAWRDIVAGLPRTGVPA
ncbi:MAG TPA: ChuX/HutX family heme-like substrate-binding protein [Rubricoccaceae bacterium]|jgi:putative hemin transport protein